MKPLPSLILTSLLLTSAFPVFANKPTIRNNCLDLAKVAAESATLSRLMNPSSSASSKGRSTSTKEVIDVGIGIEVMNGSNFVTSVTKGGAAESAGIKVGDEIQAIDGLNVLKGYPATEMIRRLNGGEGTSATVNVMHRDGIKDGPKATIKLLRKKALAAKDYEASVKDGVAVLVIRAFNPTVVSGIKTWMSSAEVKNAKGIILDVRSNPSGDMNSLLAVFSNFLPKGTQLGTLLGASKSLPLATAGNKTLQKQKVAVLLNYTGLFSYIVRYAFYIKMQPAAVMIADQASTFTQSSITFGGLMDTPLQYCAEPATFTWDLVSKGDIQVLGAYGTDGAMDRAKQEVLK